MLLKNFLKSFYEEYSEGISKNYPGVNFQILLNNTLYYLMDRGLLEVTADDFLNENIMQVLRVYLKKVLEGIPFEYIRKKAFFFNSEFFVDENVLIPRFETEILADLAIKEISKNQYTKICDIGTGPGTIGLSILRELKIPVEMTLSDISKKALDVASKNYYFLNFGIHPETKVNFSLSDRLSNIDTKFDLILSNPPYIKESFDRSLVHQKVIEYEPKIALFIEDEIYEKWFDLLFTQVYNHLDEGGTFIMEGHEGHLQDQAALLKNKNFKFVEVIKDLTGQDRFLKAKK